MSKPFGLRQLIAAAVRHDRQQLDADVPTLVPITRRSTRLYTMAGEFAAAGRTDPAAVAALRAAAGRRSKDLRRAAARCRLNGAANEYRSSYLANQLLLAAATNQPVRQITADQDDLFRRIEAFIEEDDDGFASFVLFEPRLADVERAILAEIQAALEKPTEEERKVARSAIRHHLDEALRPLVGPEADSDEPLLGTHLAYRLVYSHLTETLYRRSAS